MILLFLTWSPTVEIPDIGIDARDKIAHVLVFGFWGVLMCRSASKYEINRLPYAVKVTIIVGTLFAVIDESMQMIIPGRYCTIYDGLANFIGIWMSVPVFMYVIRPLKQRIELRQGQG